MKCVKTYRKKPIEVEAVQITDDAIGEIIEWGEGKISIISTSYDSEQNGKVEVEVETATGSHVASTPDYIVKGIDGNFYAVPYQTFKELYEDVIENSSAKDNDNCTITW